MIFSGVIAAVLTVKYYVTCRLYLSTLKPKKETKGDEKGSYIKDNDSGWSFENFYVFAWMLNQISGEFNKSYVFM